MFYYINNILFIHPKFNDELNKNIFNKFNNCQKIVFSNYSEPSLKNKYYNIYEGTYVRQQKSIKSKNYSDKITYCINDYYDLLHDIYIKSNKTENTYPNYDCYFNGYSVSNSQFNKKVNNIFPEQITSLILGWSFNQSVDNLPLSLKEITFGHEFNNLVDNLPFNLEIIIFGHKFNSPINNLPNSIKSLFLGNMFNQPIDDLPNTLERLHLGNSFDNQINNLPIGLLELTSTSTHLRNRRDIYCVPENLKYIKICGKFYVRENLKYMYKM